MEPGKILSNVLMNPIFAKAEENVSIILEDFDVTVLQDTISIQILKIVSWGMVTLKSSKSIYTFSSTITNIGCMRTFVNIFTGSIIQL